MTLHNMCHYFAFEVCRCCHPTPKIVLVRFTSQLNIFDTAITIIKSFVSGKTCNGVLC